MFRRVVIENWHTTAAAIAFALVAGVFLVSLVRALRMGSTEERRLASLPLEDQPNPSKNSSPNE
jgi:hypothetical protein